MDRPTECKYCGCEEVAAKTDSEVVFRCWSSYVVEDDYWSVSNNCGARCAVQLVEMRERVTRTVEVLEGARRYDIITGYESYMERRSDGEFIEHEEADQALEILRGNSPESPDSSPVTADQLATDDYFEAVRQRVPWMTSIEHIEGLIEGYRQCGLMVWRAAEQIQSVYGGGYGQTE